MPQKIKRSRAVQVVAGVLVGALVLVGGTSLAEQGSEPPSSPDAPPGTTVTGITETNSKRTDSITTTGTTFDPTILIKFIPASSFVSPVATPGSNCVGPGTAPGELTTFTAGVELPNGSRITGIRFAGADNAPEDIIVILTRSEVTVPLLIGSGTRQVTTPALLTTAGLSGTVVVESQIAGELVGTAASGITSNKHRFHSVHVILANNAGVGHVLCGVEVLYQVPVQANPGVVFFPVTPFRAFDSRIAAYPQSGILNSNATKVINITASHNLDTGAVLATDLVPVGATAVTFNVTVTQAGGPNFVAVTPGDATSFGVSTINFNGVMDVANGATVGIHTDRTIKLFAGPGPATHVIIDITGYYSPYIPPNMGN